MEIATAVSTITTLIEPDASEERVAVLARWIAEQDYSAAEIRMVEREAPKANHYGKFIRIDVLHGIVERSRRLRSMLDRVLTGEEVSKLCSAHPDVTPLDFACASFDRFNNPLWRYAPEIAARARERKQAATPHIEDEPSKRLRAGNAPGPLADLTAGVGQPPPG